MNETQRADTTSADCMIIDDDYMIDYSNRVEETAILRVNIAAHDDDDVEEWTQDNLTGHLVCLAITDECIDRHGPLYLTTLLGVEGVDDIYDESFDALDEELQVLDMVQLCDLHDSVLLHSKLRTEEESDPDKEIIYKMGSSYVTDRQEAPSACQIDEPRDGTAVGSTIRAGDITDINLQSIDEEVVMITDNTGANGHAQAKSSETSVSPVDIASLGLTIEGTPEMQASIRAILEVHSRIFQRSVGRFPARVTPMKLKVNKEKWLATNRNRTPARPLTETKREVLERQVNAMLALGVICRSDQDHYSQVHLVPKPNGSLRLWIDYRFLNECTETEGGVLPDINSILDRLGRLRAEMFAVSDFTSGFHQVELDEESRKYTAFITPNMGVFEWVRVPMGIKGALTYFQRSTG
jgi:hypothetical protein